MPKEYRRYSLSEWIHNRLQTVLNWKLRVRYVKISCTKTLFTR